ncbi:MAG: hypothetical protein IPI96_15655 [Saprospiraceae bacterium]|nr:hypothetical protein [Saprospiraceae bacterium]
MDFKRLFSKRFLILFFGNLILSFLCFLGFWNFYSDVPISQAQFSILASFFTIFGYFMTIYQISQLRYEKDIIHDTQNKQKFTTFKQRASVTCINTKNTLKGMINQLNTANEFNETNIQSFITILNEEKNNMVEIGVEYEAYKLEFELPCDSCMEKIDDCISDLEIIIIEHQMDSFPRTKHIGKLSKIITDITTMEAKIRL